MTSTKLGRGPALTVTPYIPDFHHFSNRGARDVIPLFLDGNGSRPNVADGLLSALSDQLAMEVTAGELVTYVYALGGTHAFCERFAKELTEGASPIHLPITTDTGLFQQAAAFGRNLLWWHTWGERFAPPGQSHLPTGPALEIAPVEGMPNQFAYNPEDQHLTVGTGLFAPVSSEVWAFEISGHPVLRSWLGYRMATRDERWSSKLNDIRPSQWTQTDELLRLLAILDHTVQVTPTAAKLLDDILASPLIPATDLPTPTPAQRKPPK